MCDKFIRNGARWILMVISHKYKYLFIELPHTASSAVRNELCELYEGQNILKKHSYYHTLPKSTRDRIKTYFTFSCIRNPADVIVTEYFKLKNNHGQFYTDPTVWKRNGGFVSNRALKRFQFIQQTHADFPTYFMRFHRHPYINWSNLSHKSFDFIIRFEKLQADFTHALSLIKIEQQRPLPIINPTTQKSKDFWSYYTPDIRPLASHVVGPFMKHWDYEFPAEWGFDAGLKRSYLEFQVVNLIKKVKWRYWG